MVGYYQGNSIYTFDYEGNNIIPSYVFLVEVYQGKNCSDEQYEEWLVG